MTNLYKAMNDPAIKHGGFLTEISGLRYCLEEYYV